jgi:hypothetical protein
LKSKALLSYRGPFYIELISVFGSNVRNYTSEFNNANKRLFRIFIELAQNVSYYSEDYHLVNNENRIGVGELNLVEHESHFTFTTKNLVKKSDSKILIDRCNLINSSDQMELRKIKREQRLNSPGEKFGARIGLIQAVMLSQNKLEYFCEEKDNDFSYLSLTVKIDKN